MALERYNAITLVQRVHSSLAALNKVLRGSSLLTPAVQKLASSLLKNEVRVLIKSIQKDTSAVLRNFVEVGVKLWWAVDWTYMAAYMRTLH